MATDEEYQFEDGSDKRRDEEKREEEERDERERMRAFISSLVVWQMLFPVEVPVTLRGRKRPYRAGSRQRQGRGDNSDIRCRC